MDPPVVSHVIVYDSLGLLGQGRKFHIFPIEAVDDPSALSNDDRRRGWRWERFLFKPTFFPPDIVNGPEPLMFSIFARVEQGKTSVVRTLTTF